MKPGAQPQYQLRYDAVSATVKGRRDRQEDSVAADFPMGTGHGFAVLADGMGGHAAGNIASNIVVTEMFSELKIQGEDPVTMEQDINATLHAAVADANACIKFVSSDKPENLTMGTTVVAPVLFEDRLYWISVGDSPLWLCRNDEIIRLNADHSLACEIDRLHASGLIDSETACNHPDRHCLTSVLMGDAIAKMDYSEAPIRLQPGDVVLVASDGLQSLEESEIKAIVRANCHRTSANIVAALVGAIEALDDPDQDNVAVCAIRILNYADTNVSAVADRKTKDRVQSATTKHGINSEDAAGALTVMSQKKADGSRVIYISKKVSM